MQDFIVSLHCDDYDEVARDAGRLFVPGTVWPTRTAPYSPFTGDVPRGGGAGYLVTLRPDHRLWLVAVLEGCHLSGDWNGHKTNTTAVADISSLLDELSFGANRHLRDNPAELRSLLAAPRRLSAADTKLLRDPPAPPPLEPPPDIELDEPSVHLRDALALMRRNDPVGALEPLIAAWNERRTAEVAETVEAVGWLVDRSIEPIPKLAAKKWRARWLEVAARGRPADVPRLMRSLGRASKANLIDFIDALGERTPDPRVVWPILDAAAGFAKGPARTAAIKFALATGDGRWGHRSGTFGAIAKRVPQDRQWLSCMREWTSQMKEKLAEPPEIGADDDAVVALIRREVLRLERLPVVDEATLLSVGIGASPTEQNREDDLLSAVYRSPGELEARWVYGDSLLEREHPRGELIKLQRKEQQSGLTKKEQARVRTLVETHGASWIGPLDAVVQVPCFRYGFLSGCHVEFANAEQRAQVVDHPAWSTVEAIEWCLDPEFLSQAPLRSLRRLNSTAQVIARLAHSESCPSLEEIEAEFVDTRLVERLGDVDALREVIEQAGLEPWATIAGVHRLTQLRRLRLVASSPPLCACFGTSAGEFGWLSDSRLAPQLESLALQRRGCPPELRRWLDVIAKFEQLRTLELAATPHSSHGSTDSAGHPDAPADLRVIVDLARGEPQRLELEIGWPFSSLTGRLRGLAALTDVCFGGFPDRRCPSLEVSYTGPEAHRESMPQLAEALAPALTPLFERVRLPDGRWLQT